MCMAVAKVVMITFNRRITGLGNGHHFKRVYYGLGVKRTSLKANISRGM